jgi:hypothetical protein
MAVALGAILGVVLVLIGVPLTLASSAATYAGGAGVAFLIVATAQWVRDRWGTRDPDVRGDLEPS